jgi:hypothetical protein
LAVNDGSADVYQPIIPKKIRAMSDTMLKAENLAQELDDRK